jgi:TRAP-type C4-dicarboxylate transport system permease small subunit
MILTTADVALRKTSTLNIAGSYEIIEMGMVLMVYLGIASLQVKDGHVKVDMLVTRFPRRLQNFLQFIMLMIEVCVYSVMTYACIIKVFELQKTPFYTAVLKLPYAPFYIVMIIGLASFTLLLLADSLIQLLQGLGIEPGGEPSAENIKGDAISKSAE